MNCKHKLTKNVTENKGRPVNCKTEITVHLEDYCIRCRLKNYFFIYLFLIDNHLTVVG